MTFERLGTLSRLKGLDHTFSWKLRSSNEEVISQSREEPLLLLTLLEISHLLEFLRGIIHGGWEAKCLLLQGTLYFSFVFICTNSNFSEGLLILHPLTHFSFV